MTTAQKKRTAADEAAETQTHETIEHNGLTFTVPLDRADWPAAVTLALEEGKAVTATRELVKPEEFDAFMRTRPTNRDFGDLNDAIARALGADDAGE